MSHLSCQWKGPSLTQIQDVEKKLGNDDVKVVMRLLKARLGCKELSPFLFTEKLEAELLGMARAYAQWHVETSQTDAGPLSFTNSAVSSLINTGEQQAHSSAVVKPSIREGWGALASDNCVGERNMASSPKGV